MLMTLDMLPEPEPKLTHFDEHIASKLAKHLLYRLAQIRTYSTDEACILGYVLGYYTGLSHQGSDDILTETQNMYRLVQSLEKPENHPPRILEQFYTIATDEGEEWLAGEKVYG